MRGPDLDIAFIKDLVDYGVMGVLGLMGFVSVWIWIERLMYFRGIDLQKYTNKERLEIDLSSHLSTIATIGANAPYIGLLGTVLGIMVSFYSIGDSGSLDSTEIIKSLALALKATAMGLLVAIPSIFFYNHMARKAEVKTAEWEILQEENSENKKI